MVRRVDGRQKSREKRGGAPASVLFRVAEHLKNDQERVAYLDSLFEDGDARVIAVGLRDLAESVGRTVPT